MKFDFKQAKREKVYSKVLIGGVSGSGKSYSALTLAKGMVDEIEKRDGKKPKIAILSTEGDRTLLYADVFEYEFMELPQPYTCELLIEALDACEEQGFQIVIIDSLSAFWSGTGGILQYVQSLGTNSIQAWARATPRFNQMMNAIVKSKTHIIACVRGKDSWDISKDDNGKTSVQKLADGIDFRANADYEFMISFMLDLKSHCATVSKDNTRLFNSLVRPLVESDGASIIKWCNDGVSPTEIKTVSKAQAKADQEKLFKETREKIKEIAMALNESDRVEEYNKVVSLLLPNKKVSECKIEDLPTMIRILDMLVEITK